MSKEKKIKLGQFFTKDKLWLKPQVKDFILGTNCSIAYDPFAGNGDLLKVAENLGFSRIKGLDIDPDLGWEQNDSLINIPTISDKTLIITNPPYLTNYSASRKKIYNSVEMYFKNSIYNDLYLIALIKMIQSQKNIVAIIPETFINSSFKYKNLLNSITILEENPFDDTDTPVIVACFDGIEKNLSKVKIYKNSKYINNLENIENKRLIPKRTLNVKFNDLSGWLAVRCVDSTDPLDKLRFDFKDNINYNWSRGIKTSSRLFTLINLDIPEDERDNFVKSCNYILNQLRQETSDIVLSPFKGNMTDGNRRRRLDFKTCRAIIELVYCINKNSGGK